MINPNDILIRKKSGGTTVWLSQQLVVRSCGVDPDGYLRRKCRYGYLKSLPPSWKAVADQPEFFLGAISGKSWRWGRQNGQFYYDLDTIPNRAPVYYRDQLPTKAELLAMVDDMNLRSSRERQAEMRRSIHERVLQLVDNDDIWYYQTYMLGDRCIFNKDKARELSVSVAWCKFIKRALTCDQYREFGLATQEDFLSICAEILARENLEGLKVTTMASLRKKIYQAPSEYLDLRHYLVSGKYGNANSRKLGKHMMVDHSTGELLRFDEHQATILDYWLNPGGATKGTKVELWEQYCSDMHNIGKEPVSYSTFTHYTNTWAIKLKSAKERHGADHFNKTYKAYTPAKPLQYANSLWACDGSGVVPYRYRDRDGKWRMMKLYVMLVSDVASKYIAGYSVSNKGQHAENYKMLHRAMTMALLDNGKTEVMDFISDNHGAFTGAESKEYLQFVCRHFRTIAPGNSQANPAETMFRLFKRRFKRYFMLPETSWNAKSLESMANPDRFDIMDLPTYSEAIDKLDLAIGQWNNTKMANETTPTEWFAIKNPEAREYDDRKWRMITGKVSNIDISYMRSFVNVSRGEVTRKFEIPNVADVMAQIAEHMGYNSSVPVTAYWDEDMADIYTRDGVYMFSCAAARLAAKSASEADSQTTQALDHNIRRGEAMDTMIDHWTSDIETAKAVLSPNYGFNIQDSSTKEGYNDMREQVNDAGYNRALVKQQDKEQRIIERQQALDAKAIREASLAFHKKKIDISKYTK